MRIVLAFALVACSSAAKPTPTVPTPAPPAKPLLALHVNDIAGDEPAILIEVGGGADSSSWKEFPAELAKQTGKRVITYDRAGFGKSEWPAMPFTFADEIVSLHVNLIERGVKSVVIVAESYGGMMALAHVDRYPAAVAGIVLLYPMNADFVDAVGIEKVAATAPKIDTPKDDKERALKYMTEGFPAFVADLRGKRWPKSLPVVVVTAGIPFWPDEAMGAAWRASHEALAKSPGASLVVATESKHLIVRTQPALVVEAIRRVLGP
ncbi:MAG TPA: alpha/beta fold hydrolase [Kofleriaceae bacterium]